MDTLVALLDHPGGDFRVDEKTPFIQCPRYKLVGSEGGVKQLVTFLDETLGTLGFEKTRVGITLLCVRIHKYCTTRDAKRGKVFSFDTGRWSKADRVVKSKVHVTNQQLQFYADSAAKLDLYQSLLGRFRPVTAAPQRLPPPPPPQSPVAAIVSPPPLSQPLPPPVVAEARLPVPPSQPPLRPLRRPPTTLVSQMGVSGSPPSRPVSRLNATKPIEISQQMYRDIISGVPTGVGSVQSVYCSLKGLSQLEVKRMELAVSQTLALIIQPSPLGVGGVETDSLSVLLAKVRNSYSRYLSTHQLVENKAKIFSVHTARWKIRGNAKGVFIDEATRLYGRTETAVVQFKLFMPSEVPTSLESSAERLPLPEEPRKVAVPLAPTAKECGLKTDEKESWTILRTKVWLNERELLLEWGVTPYFKGDVGRCFACLNPVTVATFEAAHVIPRSKGGKDELSNLRVSCAQCNHGRGGMGVIHAYEWMIMNGMPGLAIIPRSDRELVIAELLYRERTLVTALCGSSISKDELAKLKPTAPLEHRLATSWQLLRGKIPALPEISKPVLVSPASSKESVPKVADSSGCGIA